VGKLVAGLKQRPRGSFCFFGAAGTGKSEFGRYIADEIGKPTLVRRASDIFSMWLGESEKNIAAMFTQARQDDAVLILDEADSFLTDRREAQHSWEVSQVNELLTQMEAHEGIFICTTNLMQKLDPASLRRFAFKVRFDCLTPAQRWLMFQVELERLGGDMAGIGDWEAPVTRLDRLTPGDFAVAARQLELWGTLPTANSFYEQLRGECAAKEGNRQGIGFVA
jgi:SpoVK/Ycf46/Vps4 family AAA+-type ATPase